MNLVPVDKLLFEAREKKLQELRQDLAWWREACAYLRPPPPEDDEKQKLEDSTDPLV
jgi:hypothetical protein